MTMFNGYGVHSQCMHNTANQGQLSANQTGVE